MNCLSFLANLAWIVLGGFISFLLWALIGALLCITIILIPFGLQCFKIAKLSLLPFGQSLVPTVHPYAGASGVDCCLNLLWLPIGLLLAVNHLLWAFAFFITIIGIPFAWAHVKLARLALAPFGVELDTKDNRLPI